MLYIANPAETLQQSSTIDCACQICNPPPKAPPPGRLVRLWDAVEGELNRPIMDNLLVGLIGVNVAIWLGLVAMAIAGPSL